ncbi:ATP-binding protein [Umezawaea tangerina]|uniref:Tetratricopeptide repeat protein n=1 Tax=Umezawaea tangerina TaxID=84725 RepID=A0A2T0TAA6_9PSEU|nr:tetratricopeptide repeat protein [Umezawaea tangerina]PRY42591.1 tetratricopeptide repeat protein [Umezawaea tangerina]
MAVEGGQGEPVVGNAVTSSAVSGGMVQAGAVGVVELHDHSVPFRRPVPRQLPSAPHGFVGRAHHLADLDALPVIGAIGGTGGVGKTWLALTWAHRNLHRFPDGQLFADLHGFSPTGRPAHPIDVLGGFLDALGVDRDHHPVDLDRRSALFRSLVADKRMLVVLDNAATTDQITPLLPGGHRSAVLVTSRNHLPGLIARHGARRVRLDVLTDSESHTLLSTALGPVDGQVVAELVRWCGGLPLALGLVAADPRSPLSELRTLGVDALDSEDPTASLPTVLSWSLRHLTDRQREMFAMLAVAPGPDIGPAAAASLAGLSEREAHAVLRALVGASLVNRAANGRYAMHDLVRAYAISVADGAREEALHRVLDFYTHTAHAARRLLEPHRDPPPLDPPAGGVRAQPLPDAEAALAWFDAEHACLLAAQHTATTLARHRTAWHLAWGAYTFLVRRGHRHDRLTMWEASTQVSDLDLRARAHRFLGLAHVDLGDLDAATAHLDQALSLAEHHHDPDQQAHTRNALAWLWGRRGSDRLAWEHARRALDHFRGSGSVWEANALNWVGWHAARLGRHGTARDHCQDAVSLQRAHHNLEGEADALDSLGYIEHHSGHHTEAIGYYRRALALRRELGNTYYAADTLDRLGGPHLALGQHEQAREVWREALELYREQGRDTCVDRVRRRLDTCVDDRPPDHVPVV